MAERPLYTLYKNLKAQNYDVPDDYDKFESALTRDGKGGADNRHAIYENLKAQNFDVPNTYERFYSALFEPRSKTSSRAKGGSVPMTAADRARFSAGTAAILSSANNAVRQAKRNIQTKLGQAKKFDGGRVTPRLKNPLQNQNVQKNEFNYNSTTGKTGTYTTTDGVEFDNEYDATLYQNQLDKQGQQYINAVNAGEIPSVFDVLDKKGNYDLQENIGKNGTYLTEEGAQKQFDKKLADAYARKKEIEALIAEDHRQHGNPLLSYGASIGASNGRTAEQSDYSNKLATSLALVKQQIGALEAVKQYPTSSWGEDALKALDNTAFTAKTWDFGLTDFATMGQMERIKTKMDNNLPLSGSDKMLLKSKLGADAAAALEDEKMGNIYRWTKIAGQSLPFMADFFLTGGYGGITKTISRGALKFAAKRGMGKVSAAILKNTGIVAGDVIGSYAMAGTEQALKTGADIMQRHLGSLYQDEKGDYKFGTFDENGNLLHEGGESMGTALYKGLTSAMVENYTEKLFGHSYGIKKGAINFMEKHGMNASAEFFKNIGKSGWYTNSKKWMEKFGINGFGEEVMEEEIGIPLHALLDGDNKVSDLLDAKQQLDIIGGMALSVGSMYAMGSGSRPVKGIYNRAQYYRFRNKVNVADSDAQNLLGDNWADIKDKIDKTTNEQMGSVLAGILRQRDTMSKDQINAAINYGINLMKMRGYNVAKTAEMNAREITNEPTTPEEQHQEDIDNAYSEGHDADDADKHDIQLEHEDQMKTLAGLLNISEQQLSAMNDDELQSLTGQNDKLDQAIYDYQLSYARYQGVTDDAQDKIDMAANQAAQRVDMYTDKSRGSVRNATVKASGGAEDYGVYIISGNIATNEDGSINVADSDDMILFYDPTTNSVEHADALRFAELGDEVPADDVTAQAVADAKEKAIKEVAGIVDGTIDVGSQFNVTGADGMEHTYEILADYGDGTAAISIDGNVVENPYSLEDLQQMKDLEDQKRLEAAKAQREQMEKERTAQQTEQTQETEQPEETQPSLDFNQILNDNGNVVLVDVLDKDGNTKYPDSKLFLIRDTGAKAKVVEMKSDGTFVPHAVSKKNVATISSMSLDEYKQAMAETSMIEENSGAIEGDRGGIEVNDELPPVPDNVTINGDGTYSVGGAVQGGENNAAPAEQTEQTPAMTLEDGTIVPMLEDGNPDFSKLTAEQTAELYDSQFGDDADSVISGWVSDAKKALDKANNMTVKGKNFVEQKAAKEAKEKAIADAQAAYDSAIAIRDAYNSRQLAKVEDDADGRKNLIEKARRKYNRLKSAVKDDAEAVSQLYKDVVGSLLHRLYDGTGIDVTDTIPLTAEEYVASNLGAHSLNYEGTETSKGVKQETGLSREDFAKTQLLAADGKGTTIDDLVHSLWENRPSNLESLNTQDIRNALIDVLTSGFKASEARNYVENLRIAQAENFLEEQKKAADNAAFAEEQTTPAEQQTETAPESEEKTGEDNSDEITDEENEQTNENINAPEVPEDATDENPLGAQRDQTDLPFSARNNGTQQTTSERAADVEKNKVDDVKVVDNIVGQKTRKAFERLAKMMGASIQWQYSDKLGNGWIQENKDADGNVHRTIFITLDSSITEGAQFIFGHEMTHQIKNLNPAAYNELTQLVLDTYGADAFDKAVDETMKRYSDAGFSGRARDYYAEEVVADAVGEMIRDLNLAHSLAMKMSHPLLAAIHEILQKIKMAFYGTEYSDVTKNIIRSIEQAYVNTGGKEGEIFNGHRFSLKVYHGSGADFTEFDFDHMGEGEGTQSFGWGGYVTSSPEIGKYYAESGRKDKYFVYNGEKLDWRHMSATLSGIVGMDGVSKADNFLVNVDRMGVEKAKQKLKDSIDEYQKLYKENQGDFYKKQIDVMKKLLDLNLSVETPKTSLYEVDIPDDNGSNYLDWDAPITDELIDKVAKALPSLRSFDIKDLKKDRTFGNLYKTISMRSVTDDATFNDDKAASKLLSSLGYTGIKYKAGRNFGGAEVGDTNYVIFKPEDMKITEHTKFSIKTYHGSQASFDKFDHSFMGSGEGAQAYGWGTYVSEVEGIAKAYAKANAKKNAPSRLMYQGKPMTYKTPSIIYQVALDMDKFNISAKEAISKMIDADEKKLASVGDTPFAKMKAKQVQDELKVLKGLNPSDFKINDDYDTVAQNLIDTKSGLDLLEDELKDAKSYVDLYQSRLDEAKEELSKAKESGTGLGVDMYESDVEYYSEQVERYKQSIKTKESDIKDVKNKVDALQKKLDSMEKPRNLYSVDIPDDTGKNYLDWDGRLPKTYINRVNKALEASGHKTIDTLYPSRVDGKLVGQDLYDRLRSELGSQKAASLLLKDAGFDGVKVIAQRNTGGNKEGKMNYVIFDENNAQITNHTKFSLRLKSAIEETETNPSDAQKESGNYKKGHIKFGGYDYTIENPKGSTRSGKDADGKEWKVTMHDTYGYIRGKFGKDGDHLDMFINDKADLDNWNGDVFVVDQVNPDGSFDEHKVMYGYDSMDDAKKAYLANYSEGWQGLGNITGASKAEFDKWLDTSNRKLKPFADYAKVKFSQAQSVSEPRFSLDDIKPVGVGAFGNIYNQFRGKAKAAIEFLKKVRGGEAVGALHHKDIGDIDLVWGKEGTGHSDGYGLSKLVKYHPEVLDNLQEILNDMRVVSSSKNRVNLESETHKAGVRLTWDGERKSWLLTAFKKETSASDKRTDTAATSLEGDTALSQTEGSAAKIDNSSETTKENGEKFSLKDEKTMFGMHNISIDKLRKAIKQGGFAAPSMGVVDSKNGIYSDYGEITLIPKAEKLAKRTGKNAGTFTADAWTPTYPQVERIMNKQGEKAFNTDMNEKLGDVDNGIYSNIRESWKGYLSSGDVRDGLYWHYLFDKGMNPETIYQYGKYDSDTTNEVMRISANGNKTDYTDKEVAELIQLMNKATGKDNDVDAQREKLKARIASAEKQGNHLLVALKKKRLAELEGVENFYIAADFVNDVVRNNRKNGKVDVHDTMGAAKEKVENDKKLSADFPSWLDKKTEEYGVEEMLYNGTTPSGKPKYIPNTIDNAVKLMKKQGVAGGYTAFGSELGVFIAKNSPEVNTLAAMKKAKDKLIPFGDERHNQIKDKITKEFLELSDEIRVGSNNRYAFDDSGVSRMVELTDHKGNEKEYLKKAYNIEVSDEWMDRYNKLLDTIKKDYKVFYFETKFMRPYGLDEFKKAIVPSDTPSDVVDALKKAGIEVSSYERGNAEDRQKATMDAINSSDNIRFSLAGERGAAAADKAEERTARMDNLSVARKMEEEKKDAKAIKVATGWERGADGKWRYEMPDAMIKDTMDVGGGHIVKRYEDDMLWNGGKLSDVIDAPELFKAYPNLKDVRIETDAIMNDMPSNGEYNAKTNTITIHADELKYMNSILNHEIQHAIQYIEGFDRGGSPRLVRGEIKKRLAEVTKQIRQLRAEGKEDEAKAIVEKNRGLYNTYQANDDYNSYKSLAGEVEARNVQERMNMTPEERRKSLAESTEDVARKDQIFLGVGDVTFSLRDMADGKENGAADMAEDLKSLITPGEVDDAIKTAVNDMPSGWKMANKKMIHIAQALGENRKAEIAGEEPKFSLKDGTLIKAGTYFSGGGLVEEGLKGIIDPVVAVEYDEKISGVYRNNFGQHIVTADVRDVDPRELVKQIDGEVEYFHASPVCKNYSQAKSNHAEVELDKETAASTAEFINTVKPKVVTIENVKGYKDSEAMKTITDALDANGYTWDADVYNAADYGGYTNRERLIVRAVRDGKLPAKPKKMAHKSGWYEAVEDIIPTLTEKKNGVAPWMDIRLKADGIDWRNIDKPLYVMGSAYADGKVPHAFADELLPTLRTKSGDVIVMPDGKVYRAMGRVLARVSGVSDDYKMPFSENLSHTIIGNGIPTQLTEHVIAPLLTGSDPKFSIRTYHGTGAKFDKFDFSHMGEGEGSQAFGWGGYVTNSKEIAEDYTRRAKMRKNNGGFEFVTDLSDSNKDMVRHYIYKYKDVDKGLDAMRKDLSSALEMFPDDDNLKELSDILAKKNEEIAVPDDIAYLYDVDIPDDNGDYLDWENKLKKSHLNKVNKELVRIGKEPIETIYPSRVDGKVRGEDLYDELSSILGSKEAASKLLSDAGFVGIKYPAGTIFGGAKKDDYNYVIFDENNANIVGNTRFSLRYDQFEHDLNQWKKDNNLPKDAKRPTIPQRNAGESAVDFLRRVDEYRKQMALWKTAPTYEQHLLSDDTALGEFNRELQRGSVLKRIAFQDSMLAIRKAQEAIMKEVGVDRLNMAEDAYTAENRSHGKGKNEFEEYNNEFLQPLRKAYHQMKKVLGNSYDNVRIYMMAKHGLERDAQMAFKKSLEADFEDVAQRSAAYKAYKGDMNRIINDSDLEFGRVDFTTWRQRDNALRAKYSPSYMDYRYDKNGIAYDYSGLSALFDGSDFEETAYKLVKDIEDKYVTETHNLWDATNAATKKILRDGYKAGMMSKDAYQYVRDMYSHYIPLRGWDGTTADQVWDYIGGGKGAFNQTLKTAHGRTSIADDPIAYIENMAESGILLNNKNWVKQHLMLLAQNHPTSLLTLSKAWYVKSTDANGNEEWIPATPQITSQMNSNQVKAAIDAFEKKMEQMAQTGDATQKRDGLSIAYPQTHSEEREHEVRVMKDGEEYVIYVNGDPQLAQAMNNTRAHRVREIQSGKLDRAAAWLGRKMAAAYTSLSPLFIPSNYFRDLTMTLASTAIREDAKYNYLLRKNLATSWNLGFMLRDYQNGKLREKVSNGNATPKEQMFYDFMMNGGETGFVSSLDVEDLKKKFKNDLKDLDRWKANPVKVGHTIMDGIEFLNRAIEDSNRFAVYMTSIQYGRSIDEAVNDAKDVTLNFNRKGTGEYGWQMVRNLYLFINPAVQSLQTLGALVKHHPFKFTAVTASWLASGVLVPIVNAALMSMLGGDDDKDKYWQFSKWDRRNNAIMWIPFTHKYVKIPLAQEFRAFYGIGDMIASKMMGGELAEESWSQYAEDMLGQVVDMLPLDPTGYDGNIAVSLMPNAIRPVFELAFNVDFTGKPLFKDTEYNKYDPNFTKAYVGTPDWLVRASRMVNSIGNDYPDVQQNSIDAFGDPRYNLNNPAVVDHVLSSYLGGAYTMGSQVLGLLTKSLNDPKEIKVADIPLFSKFVSNPDDRPVTKKQGDEFWDMKENHDRAANTLSKLKKQAKVDGDYSMLERFYDSEEYKQYKQDDVKVKKYEEDKKKERAEESGEEYRPHKLNAEDIYKAHATPKDDFEDLKLKQLYTKLNGFKTSYDLLVDTAPSQSDGYYNTNKAAIDAIDEISLDKQEISELKKGFLEDGKDAYNAEDMKRIRELRKRILSVLEPANKVVVARQKAKAEKK